MRCDKFRQFLAKFWPEKIISRDGWMLLADVSHFSPYIFAVSYENRATPLKLSQKRSCRTRLGGGAVAPQLCTV